METITVQLRLADPQEFATGKGRIVLGKLFFLKSVQTGRFDKGVYYTYDGMNLNNLRDWFRNDMVYVPINPIEAISINEQQPKQV